MRVFEQLTFSDPTAGQFSSESLTVHRRSSRQQNSRLILLVHGLQGHSYGGHSTWQRFPEFLYDDFPKANLAFYSYRTGVGRLKFWRSADIGAEAKALASRIRALSSYNSIVLVGHSLGGLVAKAAIAHLVGSNQKKVLRRLTGLVLLATPQLGSAWAMWPMCYVTEDLRTLRFRSTFIQDVNRVFVNHLSTDAKTASRSPKRLPTWAVVATQDFWVSADSAIEGVPDAQVLHVACSHTEVCKPSGPSDDVYLFVKDCLLHAFKQKREELEWDSYTSIRASDDDVIDLLEIARAHVSPDVSSEDQVRAIMDLDPDSMWTVRRLVGAEPGPIVGYFVVLRLRAEAAIRIRSEEITGAQLQATDIVAPGVLPASVYIGSVAGIGTAARAIALDKLKIHLAGLLGDASAEILTRPVTKDGLRTVRQHGFRPYDPLKEGLGHLYIASHPEILHFNDARSGQLKSISRTGGRPQL